MGTSLQSYQSAEEAKGKHLWCIDFEPGAVWENGMPVVPARTTEPRPGAGGEVEWGPIDMDALGKSCETMIRHWIPME